MSSRLSDLSFIRWGEIAMSSILRRIEDPYWYHTRDILGVEDGLGAAIRRHDLGSMVQYGAHHPLLVELLRKLSTACPSAGGGYCRGAHSGVVSGGATAIHAWFHACRGIRVNPRW